MFTVVHKARNILTSAFLVVCILASPVLAGPETTTRQERIDKALAGGVTYLLKQITETGEVKHEYGTANKHLHHGGLTALTVYALLAADVSPRTPELARAINWLASANLQGTYPVALRACAMAEWNDPKALSVLKRDVEWLIGEMSDQGNYWYYRGYRAARGVGYDNSATQLALLGIWAASKRGIKIPTEYWRKAEGHWLSQQNHDGGWSYHSKQRSSYGSMAAAGLASMYITFDALHQRDFLQVKADSEYKPITKGLTWLGENFSASRNPRKNAWYFYWLYSIERVGLASGLKYFGTHNWYAECVDALTPMQDIGTGAWLGDRSNSPQATYQTAFAVLFLARGRHPVLINKLRYPGRWNTRPRDCANLTDWLSWNFERQVSWQVIDINSDVSQWHDAPILYISGSGTWEPEDEQIKRLRTYVLQGGTIIAESAGNNSSFTTAVRKVSRRMFPNLPLERLPDDHPIYGMYFKPKGTTGLHAVSNGLRLMMIHSPAELSRDLQIGKRKDNVETFELLANFYMLATDKGTLRPRGTTHWPKRRKFTPAATINVTRLKFEGNYDPEPLAWDRLSTIMANRHSIKLNVSSPIDITKLDASVQPIAVMTGAGKFQLTEAQIGSLMKYFRDGGTLIIDAAGGSRKFDRSVFKQILTLPQDAIEGPLASKHQIYQWPEPIKKVSYRREFALSLGKARREPRLRAVTSNGRVAIIYSREDITSGLVGYNFYGIRGYSPDSAVNLMINLVSNAARRSATPTQPAQPAPTDK